MLKVSVIIPNYNRENLIGRTLDNLLAQTLKPAEIIVVDDGSTDRSLDVIGSFGPKVTLVRQNHKGTGAARNAGLEIAQGDYIQFMDSDDLCTLNKLENQAQTLERHNADLVYGPWVKLFFDNKNVLPENHVLQQKPLPAYLDPIQWFLRSWVTVMQACMVRRSFIKKVGMFRTDLLLEEDDEFLFHLLLYKPKLVFASESLMLYALHNSNKMTESGTSLIERLVDEAKLIEVIQTYLVDFKIHMDLATWLVFTSRLWELKKELGQHKDFKGDLLNKGDHNNKFLTPIFYSVKLAERIEKKIRHEFYGSRFTKLYQSSYLTETQKKLIENMGFKILSNPKNGKDK